MNRKSCFGGVVVRGALAVVLLAVAKPADVHAQGAVQPRDSVEAAAATFAAEWLALLDRGDHAEAWRQNFSMMRASVPLDQWREAIVQSRLGLEPLGPRALVSLDRGSGMGPVTGEQFMLGYRTGATGGTQVGESVVLTREDGEWRVAGYGLRR